MRSLLYTSSYFTIADYKENAMLFYYDFVMGMGRLEKTILRFTSAAIHHSLSVTALVLCPPRFSVGAESFERTRIARGFVRDTILPSSKW